jgi:hypothetical protein
MSNVEPASLADSSAILGGPPPSAILIRPPSLSLATGAVDEYMGVPTSIPVIGYCV